MAKVDIIKVISETGRASHANNYEIRIKTGGGDVVGQMTNEFNFDVSAEWEQLLSMNGVLEGGQKVMQALGSPAFTTGIFTRKFYKGGSHVNFNLEFRVVDWDGRQQNNVVTAATNLANLMLPIKKSSVSVINELKNAGGALVDGLVQLSKGATSESDFFSKLGKSGVGAVSVRIGNFFQGDLILLSMNAKYSKEQTSTGPLYGDFTVNCSTAEVPGKGDLNLKSGASRVKVTDSKSVKGNNQTSSPTLKVR